MFPCFRTPHSDYSACWSAINWNHLCWSREMPETLGPEFKNTVKLQIQDERTSHNAFFSLLQLQMHLCCNPTFHHPDVVVRRSSFVHLNAAVGDHKHGPVWELDIGGPQRLELYQLRLISGWNSVISININHLNVEILQWWEKKSSYSSFLCQEWYGLVHASSLCPDVALTFGTYLS